MTEAPGPPPTRDREAEQTIVVLYRDRLHDVTADIMASLSSLFHLAATDADVLAADIQERVASTLRGTVQAMADGVPLAMLGPEIEKVARLRRDQQISQEMLFAGYQVIQRTVFERIIQDVRARPDAGRLISGRVRRRAGRRPPGSGAVHAGRARAPGRAPRG